jgi:hypothetical protein
MPEHVYFSLDQTRGASGCLTIRRGNLAKRYAKTG